MGFFSRNKKMEERATSLEDLILQAQLNGTPITKEQMLSIPAVQGSLSVIQNIISMLKIKLYKLENNTVTEIEDNRVDLLNKDTGDTLDACQFKKAIVEDYLVSGNSYVYIKRKRNKIESIHYVKQTNISVNQSVDPIFKDYKILCNGQEYNDYEFLKLLRKTDDGATGKGILEECNEFLQVPYHSLKFENVLVKTGGNKKGFIKSSKTLTKEAIDTLKAAWKKLYGNNDENVVILNNGLEFQEASNTSVEMQLNENKKTNASDIGKTFLVPLSILEGKATEDEFNNFIKVSILPILTAIETALNRDLLLPSEKKSLFFAFDTNDLVKGDIEKRYRAYEIASKNGIMQIDEIRKKENLPSLDLGFIKLGLQDVLYDPKTKTIYTPNTNMTADMDNLKSTTTPVAKGGDE